MRKEIADLAASVANLEQQNAVLVAKVDAEVANSNALKAALNAAISGQLSTEELQSLADSRGSIDGAVTSLGESAQKLADSAAVNSPSN